LFETEAEKFEIRVINFDFGDLSNPNPLSNCVRVKTEDLDPKIQKSVEKIQKSAGIFPSQTEPLSFEPSERLSKRKRADRQVWNIIY
jgi:hypothetical protein